MDNQVTPVSLASTIKVTAIATRIILRKKDKLKPHELYRRIRRVRDYNDNLILKSLPKRISFKDMINSIYNVFELEVPDNTDASLSKNSKPPNSLANIDDDSPAGLTSDSTSNNSQPEVDTTEQTYMENRNIEPGKGLMNLSVTGESVQPIPTVPIPTGSVTLEQGTLDGTKVIGTALDQVKGPSTNKHNENLEGIKNTPYSREVEGKEIVIYNPYLRNKFADAFLDDSGPPHNNPFPTVNKGKISSMNKDMEDELFLKRISNGIHLNIPAPFSQTGARTNPDTEGTQDHQEIFAIPPQLNYMPLHLPLFPNQLSQDELIFQTKVRIEQKCGPFHPDFIHPEDKFILRCPLCANARPINNRGSLTSVRAHIRNHHKLDLGGYKVSIEMILGPTKMKTIIIDSFPKKSKHFKQSVSDESITVKGTSTPSSSEGNQEISQNEPVTWENVKYKPFKRLPKKRLLDKKQ